MSKPKIKLPKLNRTAKCFLFLSTLVFCVLACVCAVTDAFYTWARVAVYTAACCTLVLSVCYLIAAIRHGTGSALRSVKEKHPLLAGLSSDYRRKSFLMAVPGSVLNLVFTVFNGIIGFTSPSAWYVSLSVYYLLLFLMRSRILYYEFAGKNCLEEAAKPLREWQMYRRCGGVLLLASIALSGVVVLIVRNGHGKHYPGSLIYAVALYTFWKAISSVRNIRKARKLKAPLLICARNICCADALVSILSLETAMFASFSKGDTRFDTGMVEITGSVVCVFVILMGCFMLISGSRQIAKIKAQNEGGDDL